MGEFVCAVVRLSATGATTALAVLASLPAMAQNIEPRAYSPAPVGVNFVIVGYAWTERGLSFDTSVPVTDPDIESTGPIVAYARTLDLLGRSGKVDITVDAVATSDHVEGRRLARTA